MRVFVTGASGHIGSAVVPELLTHGHEVVGLARSEASAAKLAEAGAEVVRGTLDDLDLLREQAAASDGVIHLAFKHESMFSGDYEGAIGADLTAIEALGDGLAGSGKPFVGTSGSMMLATEGTNPRAGTEDEAATSGPRAAAETLALGLADRGVRSSVIRLAPSVHSYLDLSGFVPSLIGFARQAGFAAYVGDGAARWPGVHTLDAAVLYRLALERGEAGSRFHGTAEEGVAFREIAETIGRGLGLPTKSVPTDEAGQHLSFLAGFSQLDNPTSSDLTQQRLGWQPTGPGLLDDIEEHYFTEARLAR